MTPELEKVARLVDQAEMLMVVDGRDEPLRHMSRDERRRELTEAALALIREGKIRCR